MSRSFRVGVVLHNQLVEERIFRATAPITFGQSLRCALSIPADGIPREHVLFACDDGQFQLRLTADMAGRLGHATKIATFDELRLAPHHDHIWSIPLARGARGKLAIGAVTILFQEIATPPATPRPRLPASIRGTFSDRIDRRLAVIIGASLVAHVAIAAWAWSSDLETTVLGQSSLSEFHQDTIDVMLPDHAEPTQPGIATPVQPPHSIVPTHTPSHAAASDPQQLAQDARRLAGILTGDEGTHGFGGMSHRQPGADLNHQIDDARNHTITIGDDGHTSRVDDRAHIGTDPDRQIPLDDPNFTRTDPTHHTEHPGRIQLVPLPSDTSTTLTPSAVLDKIQNVYMTGLQRCYLRGLEEDATLEGKVAIDFTVESHGRVTDPEAAGLTAKVDACVTSLMANWHFPAPRDKAGEPTDASFKISLVLRPGK